MSQNRRSVDHLVLPTGDLDLTRARLSALGFNVAPEADHPFGSCNACVFFSDGTYLEPLAIAHRDQFQEAADAGNVFAAHDLMFRMRRGEDGFSAVAFGTDDADADREAFVEAGVSAGDNLKFSRPYKLADGGNAVASFALAFAADERAPDAFFFTCQRVTALNIDRSQLERHSNGVEGIRRVILSDGNPSDFQYVMQTVIDNREIRAHSLGMDIEAANVTVSVMTDQGLTGHFGIDNDQQNDGLTFAGAVFSTLNLDALESLFTDNRIEFLRVGERLTVPPAPGQGTHFVFEAS